MASKNSPSQRLTIQLQLYAMPRLIAKTQPRELAFNRHHVAVCWPDTLERIHGYWRDKHPDLANPDYFSLATQRALALLRQSQETK